MSNPKRLHPAAMIFRVISIVRSLIFAIGATVIVTMGNDFFNYIVLGIVGLIAFFIITSVIEWLRFRYAVVGDELRIEQGLIVRKKRYISKNRIQSIDLTQSVIHRLFNLTKVQIETAGSDLSTDASLSAVKLEEGQALRKELKYHNGEAVESEYVDETEQDEEEQYTKETISTKRLVIAGSTSGSIGVILGLFIVLFSEVERFIPTHVYDDAMSWFVTQTISVLIVLALIVLIFLWVLGILGTVIKYGNFEVTRYEDELYITRGLLEKKQVTIPLKRIQALGIKESVVRQPLGFATLYVEIAGGEGGQNARTFIFPLLKRSEVKPFLEKILPEYRSLSNEFTGVPNRAAPYYMLRASFLPVVVLIVTLIFAIDFWYIPFVLILLAMSLGWLRMKTAGYYIDREHLIFRSRDFSKDTIMMKHNRVQSIQLRQTLLHRKQQIATVQSSILNNFAGRHAGVRELDYEQAKRIADWYSLQKRIF
ncbi:PH domain-containing protein [Alkalibacillus haloalkaliphilus]|uniref:PH domain-containing protein n=1 Tax=Alkalibacillus haloalkaliphilus TaxID=94136 RepID=UPI002936AD32|nr:PH domain-containing protein [Alkalibacillus haloalkaliphilus]MDV2582609.1 PH domain-containing protein [Alkalibacillus haloalkaliphilus]